VSILAATLAFVIGLTLGLLGGGGSILTVPVFVYALHYDPKVAIAMSYPVVGGVALVGALRRWRLGHVDLRTALPFGLAAMVAAYGGALIARFIPGQLQLLLLGLVMAAAAVSMMRPSKDPAIADGRVPSPEEVRRPRTRAELVGLGVLVGLLTGIVGVGGGFLMVPALVLLGGLTMDRAAGTSLLLIAMNTGASLLGYHGMVDIEWGVVLAFGAVATVGILVGSAVLDYFDQDTLRRAFAVLLVVVALWILWQNRLVFIN
jgi:uncharacterized membrane protein YfcA